MFPTYFFHLLLTYPIFLYIFYSEYCYHWSQCVCSSILHEAPNFTCIQNNLNTFTIWKKIYELRSNRIKDANTVILSIYSWTPKILPPPPSPEYFGCLEFCSRPTSDLQPFWSAGSQHLLVGRSENCEKWRLAHTKRIFMKFDIWIFFENLKIKKIGHL